MAKLMNFLAASVGGGIVLGATIRIGEALATGTHGSTSGHGLRVVSGRDRNGRLPYSDPRARGVRLNGNGLNGNGLNGHARVPGNGQGSNGHTINKDGRRAGTIPFAVPPAFARADAARVDAERFEPTGFPSSYAAPAPEVRQPVEVTESQYEGENRQGDADRASDPIVIRTEKPDVTGLLITRLEQMEARLAEVAAASAASEAAAAFATSQAAAATAASKSAAAAASSEVAAAVAASRAAAATAASEAATAVAASRAAAATQMTPAPAAQPEIPAEWHDLLDSMVNRIDRQQADLESIREQMAKAANTVVSAGEIAGDLHGNLSRQIGDDLDRRLTQVEEKLHRSMESALSETVDAMVHSIETKVAPRITRLEKDMAGQSTALTELRDCSIQSDRSIQRLVAVMERVMLPQAGIAPRRPVDAYERRAPELTYVPRRPVEASYNPRRAGGANYETRRPGEPAYEPRRPQETGPEDNLDIKPRLDANEGRKAEAATAAAPQQRAVAPVPEIAQKAAEPAPGLRSVLGGRLPAEVGVNGPTARRPALFVDTIPVTVPPVS